MLKIDRALQEVWNWKDAIYKDSKDKSARGISKTIRKETENLKKSKRFHFKKAIVSH